MATKGGHRRRIQLWPTAVATLVVAAVMVIR